MGARLGQPREPPPPSRRAFAEHVQATGALYAKTGLAAHALAAYFAHVDSRVRAKMPRGSGDPAAFVSARSGADAAACARVWRRAAEARAGEARGDELTVLAELAALVTAFEAKS